VAIAGFASVVGALLVAHYNPATGYELSLYRATPVGFWIGIAVAFASALSLAFLADDGLYRRLGVAIGGLASLSVVALPTIRGYYFLGIHDALTHLGLARGLAEGSILPGDLFYPGLHTLAAFVHGMTGLSIWHSMLLVPLCFVLIFFAFTTLSVCEIAGGDAAMVAGAFSAFLLVPVHLIANTLTAHPSSQTILFAPIIVFLLVRFLRTPEDRSLGVFTSMGVALLLVVFGSILYHPQQALNVVILLVVLTGYRYVAARYSTYHWVSTRQVALVASVSVIAYLGWVLQSPAVVDVASGAVDSVTAQLAGGTVGREESVTTQTSALQAIGSSLLVVFLKLFFVSTTYIVLTGLVLLGSLRNSFRASDVRDDTVSVTRYLGLALVVMFPVFLFYLVGNVASHYFREAGFMLMLGTAVGAVGIAYATKRIERARYSAVGRMALVGGLAVLLILSMGVVYNSPYMNKATQHITEARVDGYHATFETANSSAEMAGIRQEPRRYYEAMIGSEFENPRDGSVNSSEIRRLAQLRAEDWYLTMHSNTYQREIRAYEEYRFTEIDLRSVQRQENVGLVYSNGDMELYYVTPDS